MYVPGTVSLINKRTDQGMEAKSRKIFEGKVEKNAALPCQRVHKLFCHKCNESKLYQQNVQAV